jgi:glycosyltransferase 2 family protein
MSLRLSKIFPLIGLLIFAYLIISTGPEKIMSAFASADVSYFVPAALLLFAYLGFQSLKWGYLLGKQRIRPGLSYVFRVYMIGVFYGSVTPGRLGNLIRVKYVKKKTGKSTGEASISVVLDKLLDVASLLAVGLFGIVLLSDHISSGVMIPMTVSLALVLSCIIVLLNKNMSRSILRTFWRFLVPSHLKSNTKETFNSFYDSMLSARSSLVPFLMGILGWFLIYASAYSVALSIGINVPFQYFMVIMSIATVVGLIPITVAGWGTREATLVMFLSLFGVTAEQAIVMSILNNLLNYAVVIPTGLACSLSEEKVS